MKATLMVTIPTRSRGGLVLVLAILTADGRALAQSPSAPAPAPAAPTAARVIPPPPPPPSLPTPPPPAASPAPSPAAPSAAPPVTAPPAAPAPAADTGGDLSATLTGVAREEYEAGKLLFRDRDYAGALVKFESAFNQSHEARLLFNMAACEKNLRHYAKTIRDFERYRDAAGASLPPAERDQVEKYIHEFQPFVAPVLVTSGEAGASVYVDDELLGTTPLDRTLRVDIGLRHVRVAKEGFREFTSTIAVSGSSEMHVSALLEKIVHEGRVVVHAGAKDSITIDGEVVGTGQFAGPLPSGGHQLKVTADDMVAYQSELVIQDNQTRSVDVTLHAQARGGLPLWAWVAGGAVLAGGLAVGGYFLLRPQEQTTPAAVGTINPGVVNLSFR